ncbi:hypothetical protein Sros01_03440 [Streptomyces roseochromogenus]|nr:hypothetical protein Sros01_03440 [Streptomyces roseochromogenus]
MLPYVTAYVVMLLRQRRARRAGRDWACEEWRLHLTALPLAPVVSVCAAPGFERYLGLDRQEALSAVVTIGWCVMAFAAAAVGSLRVLYGRAQVKREAADGRSLANRIRPASGFSPA